MTKITKTLLATAFTVGVALAAVMDPNTRMEKVRELFTEYGADTFKILNGQDIGGTGSSESGKSHQVTERADIATIIKSDDGNAFVFCVQDSKWKVYPPEPTKIDTSAMTATDSNGMPFTETMINGIRKSPNGKAQVVYYVDTPGGKERRIATVWSSRNLLQRKNNTGSKFFCGTSIKAEKQ